MLNKFKVFLLSSSLALSMQSVAAINCNAPEMDNIIRNALEGDIVSQIFLADMYYKGDGVKRDYQKALYWYQKVAYQGDVDAQTIMGILYCSGYVKKDYEESFKWFRLASNNGSTIAQNMLGLMYLDGKGVEQDVDKAIHYFSLAAEQHLPEASYNLANIYYQGIHVDKDKDRAITLYKDSCQSGYQCSCTKYEELTAK